VTMAYVRALAVDARRLQDLNSKLSQACELRAEIACADVDAIASTLDPQSTRAATVFSVRSFPQYQLTDADVQAACADSS
jgi:hypothetical protein